jgi:hypothetical protein
VWAGQRHEQDLGVGVVEEADPGQAAPGLAAVVVGAGAALRRLLAGHVAPARQGGVAGGGGGELAGVDMDGGPREVRDAAGVIEVEGA